MHKSIIHNAEEIVVGPARDAEKSSINRYENAAIVSIDGEVQQVGPTDDVLETHPVQSADTSIDVSGKSVIPGFVDSHTHSLFAGDRSDEFAAKLQGKSYQEILSEGGGILRTVQAVREADRDQLLDNLFKQLDVMLSLGSTTVEVKSGYGLDTEAELKMLSTIQEANENHPVDVIPTYLGAHAIPESKDGDAYVQEIIDDQIPAIRDQGIANFIDVFCEEDVFTVEQSRQILKAGRRAGMKPKIHADEFTRLGGAQLAAELNCVSADHLLNATLDDVQALVDEDVIPTLLPGTAFSINSEYADARKFLDLGADVS
ncbi:MAG: imidazolonepropionase, partial [Halobacteriaceae archaeon]